MVYECGDVWQYICFHERLFAVSYSGRARTLCGIRWRWRCARARVYMCTDVAIGIGFDRRRVAASSSSFHGAIALPWRQDNGNKVADKEAWTSAIDESGLTRTNLRATSRFRSERSRGGTVTAVSPRRIDNGHPYERRGEIIDLVISSCSRNVLNRFRERRSETFS